MRQVRSHGERAGDTRAGEVFATQMIPAFIARAMNAGDSSSADASVARI